MSNKPLGYLTSFFRWRWKLVPKAKQRLLRLVQIDGISEDEQAILNKRVLDEDERVFALLDQYERMGKWSNDPLPKDKKK